MPRIIDDDPRSSIWVRYPGATTSEVADSPTSGIGGRMFGTLLVIFLILLLLWSNGYLPISASEVSLIRPITDIRVVPPPTGVRYVVAESLNLREEPGNAAYVNEILGRGTRVVLLGERHREIDGDEWVRVRVDTLAGPRFGWVDMRYIA